MSKKDDNSKSEKIVSNKILGFDKRTGLLIPIRWKYPFFYRKKNYIALIVGLSDRYEFERIFLEKIEFERDDESSSFGVGFSKTYFRDGLILEEKYSYKEANTFVTKINYYKIYLLDEDGVYGEQISKSKIKDEIYDKQQQIFQELREIVDQFGEDFTIYTMKAILKQKEKIHQRRQNLSFF